MARLLSANPGMKAVMQAFSAMRGAGSPRQSGHPTTAATTTTTTKKPAAALVSSSASWTGSQGTAGAPGMNMLNNMMNMMFTHQALQDAPDFYPLGSHAMMGRGTAGMGMGSLTGMPNFNMFGQTAAPGPQHTGGSTGTGNTGIPLQGMGMGDIFRMLG